MADQKNKRALIKTAVGEGETYLGGQLTLATSADQRAAILGGVFTAAGTAIIAGLIAAYSAGFTLNAILFGGLVAAILFLVGAGMCVSTVMPVSFNLPGNEPASWKADIERDRALIEALEEEAANFQSKIEDNRTVIKKNAKRFKWGAVAGITAPVAGLIVWLLVLVPS